MNETELRQYIKAQRAAGVPLRALAAELGIDKMKVDRIAKTEEDDEVLVVEGGEEVRLVDKTKPRNLKQEAKVAADYAQATPETKDDVIWCEAERWDLENEGVFGRTEAVAIRKWSEDDHAWDEEQAAFVKLTTEEKLGKFRWRSPKPWPSFYRSDRHFGVGRDDVTSWSYALTKPLEGSDTSGLYPVWPSALVKLLSEGLNEDVEKLLDRAVRGEYKGTGRVDKGKITRAFRWLVMEVELQRQANLALRWALLKRRPKKPVTNLLGMVKRLQTKRTVMKVANSPAKTQSSKTGDWHPGDR